MTMDRYYFDDGTSRKFWEVACRGKTVVTAYGRLGTSGRKSTKQLASPKEAQQTAERLTASKTKAGYVKVDPALLRIKKIKGGRKATAAQVAKLESMLGMELPEEYRVFLRSQNGGHPEPGGITVYGHTNPYGWVGFVSCIFALQKSAPRYASLYDAIERTMPILPQGHLPIANANGDPVTIDTLKKRGSVFIFDHESPEYEDEEGVTHFKIKHATLLAGTFNEFLTRIAVHTED